MFFIPPSVKFGWPRMHDFFSPLRMENVEFTRRYLTQRLFYISEMKTSPFGGLRGLTNSRIDYRGEVEKIEFAQRFMKKMLRLLGANPHFLIPYFYSLIIYSRSFLFMRDRQFNNRILCFTFYIGYSTFYIPLSFFFLKKICQRNLFP